MSFLSAVGSFFKKVFQIGTEAATLASPIISIAFPEIAPLYTSALGAFVAAETAVAAVPGQSATKLSISVQTLLPIAQQFAQKNGLDWPEAEITKWASAVVDTLNMIPAPKTTAEVASASTTAASMTTT